MFCILVVLVKLSVIAKWLAIKTSLKKPNRDDGTVSTKQRLKSFYNFLGLLYYFVVLSRVCVVPHPFMIYFILLWHDIACLCLSAVKEQLTN